MEFNIIWDLLAPQGEYKRRENPCRRLWQSFSDEQQHRIFAALSEAKARGDVINLNPYFAIEDTALALRAKTPRRQTLSFNDYYNRYGTTEETDGWQQANPTGNKVIYVKE